MPLTPRSRGPRSEKFDPDRILTAAQEIFASDGVRGGSIRSIARQAGCDPALIYYHFENKEGIFAALFDRKIPGLLQDLKCITADGETRHTAQLIWEVLGVYQKHMAQDAGFRAMIRGEIVRGAEGMRNVIAQHVQPVMFELVGLLEKGVQRGLIRPDVIPIFGVFFLVRMELEILDLMPVMSQRLANMPPEQGLPIAQRQWFQIFWRGIARHPDEALPFELGL